MVDTSKLKERVDTVSEEMKRRVNDLADEIKGEISLSINLLNRLWQRVAPD